jgi:hypothetical protein
MDKPQNPWALAISMALISSVLSIGVSWITFESSQGNTLSDQVARETEQVKTLEARQAELGADFKSFEENLRLRFVTQEQFTQFQRQFDDNMNQTHDFQVRIDTKMDDVIMALTKNGRMGK